MTLFAMGISGMPCISTGVSLEKLKFTVIEITTFLGNMKYHYISRYIVVNESTIHCYDSVSKFLLNSIMMPFNTKILRLTNI